MGWCEKIPCSVRVIMWGCPYRAPHLVGPPQQMGERVKAMFTYSSHRLGLGGCIARAMQVLICGGWLAKAYRTVPKASHNRKSATTAQAETLTRSGPWEEPQLPIIMRQGPASSDTWHMLWQFKSTPIKQWVIKPEERGRSSATG